MNKLPINPDEWKDEIKQIGGWLGRLFGPLVNLSDIANDQLQYYRLKRQLGLKDKLQCELQKRGYEEIPGSIEVSFGVPLIEAASLEEDESMQTLWANLLANSLDPEIKEKPKKSYIDILRQMDSNDARLINDIYVEATSAGNRYIFTKDYPEKLCSSNNEKLEGYDSKPDNSVCLSIENLIRLGLLTTPNTWGGTHYHERVELSRMGINFVESVKSA